MSKVTPEYQRGAAAVLAAVEAHAVPIDEPSESEYGLGYLDAITNITRAARIAADPTKDWTWP